MTARIDDVVTPSFLRYVYWSIYVGAVMLLTWSLGLVWWQWLVVLFAVVALWWSAVHKMPKLRHVTEPSFTERDERWQYLVETPQGEQLWQGDLVSIKDFNLCLCLELQTVTPVTGRQRFLIYPDQLSFQTYRRLKVQAHMH